MSFKGKGVSFIGVFVTSQEKEISRFAETYRITFPVGKENGIAEKLGVTAVPTTVFIGKDGSVVKKHVGQIDYAGIVSGINEILK